MSDRSTKFSNRYGFQAKPEPATFVKRAPKFFRCIGCERSCCTGCGMRCKTDEEVDQSSGRYCASAACILIEAQSKGILSEVVERSRARNKVDCEHSK